MRINQAKAYEKTRDVGKLAHTAKGSNSAIKRPVEGEIIKGEIVDIRQNQVTVKLSDGRTLQGKMTEQFEFTIGQEVSFVVKESSDTQLLIKPMLDSDVLSNTKLLEILGNANKPITEENLNIVMKLIEGNFPVDKESLNHIINLTRQFGRDKLDDLLFLLKNDISISHKSLQQLELFKNNEGQILNNLASLSEDLSTVSHTKEGQEIVHALISKNETYVKIFDSINGNIDLLRASVEAEEMTGDKTSGLNNIENEKNTDIKEIFIKHEGVNLKSEQEGERTKFVQKGEGNQNKSAHKVMEQNINQLLPEKEVVNLQREMASLIKAFSDVNNSELKLLTNLENKSLDDILKLINKEVLDFELKDKLLNSIKENVTKHLIKSETLMNKDVLTNPKAYNKYFEKLSDKINGLIKLNHVGDEKLSSVIKEAASAKSNIEFMSDLNKNFNFMQFPMLIDQKVINGELYVFENKKQLKNKKSNLTALVRLDLVNLGHLDAYVVKNDNNIDCKFFSDDIESANKLKKHVFKLHNVLQEAGFNVLGITVVEKDINFNVIEDFMEEHSKANDIKRVSFDMRA